MSHKRAHTILKVIGLSLAPHVQLLAIGFHVLRDAIEIHYDPLGGRNQPLIRSGVTILLPESAELVVDGCEGRGFVSGRGRCARIVGVLSARAGGAMMAHGYLVGQRGGLDGILSLIKNIG